MYTGVRCSTTTNECPHRLLTPNGTSQSVALYCTSLRAGANSTLPTVCGVSRRRAAQDGRAVFRRRTLGNARRRSRRASVSRLACNPISLEAVSACCCATQLVEPLRRGIANQETRPSQGPCTHARAVAIFTSPAVASGRPQRQALRAVFSVGGWLGMGHPLASLSAKHHD